MWKKQGSWNFFHAKLIPNSSITYPLMVAVDKNNINMVKILLKYGAKTKVRDKSGKSSIFVARHHKNVEMIKLLEKSR